MTTTAQLSGDLLDTFLGTPIFVTKSGQFKAIVGHSSVSMASLASLKKKIAEDYNTRHVSVVKLQAPPSSYGKGMDYEVVGLTTEHGQTLAKTKYGTRQIESLVWPDDDLNKEAEALVKAHTEAEQAYKNALVNLGKRYRRVTLEDLKAALERKPEHD